MLRELFRSGGKGIDLPLAVIGNGPHRSDLRRPIGERSCFIKGCPGNRSQPFKSVAFPDEKAMLCGISDRRHDGRRRGKHQRTGAEYNEYRDSADDFPGKQPCECRRRERPQNNPGRPAIRKRHDLRPAGICGPDKPDHPPDQAVFTDPRGAHVKHAELVDGPAGNLVPHRLVRRERFSRHDRLVHGGAARYDHPVHRDRFAGKDPDQIPALHFLYGDESLSGFGDHTGDLRRKAHELLNAGPCSFHGQALQQRAEPHDESYLAGGKNFADA